MVLLFLQNVWCFDEDCNKSSQNVAYSGKVVDSSQLPPRVVELVGKVTT